MQPDDIELILDANTSEDSCLLFDVVTPDGVLQLLGDVEIGGDHLVVRNLHVGAMLRSNGMVQITQARSVDRGEA